MSGRVLDYIFTNKDNFNFNYFNMSFNLSNIDIIAYEHENTSSK